MAANALSISLIFDCDGSRRQRAHRGSAHGPIVTELGGRSPGQAKAGFGRHLRQIIRRVERELGRPVPESWPAQSQARLLDAFRAELRPVAGVRSAVERLVAAGALVAVGSQGTLEKMQLTLALTELLPFFAGRIFSASQVAHPKPAPDLFCCAAQSWS